jgi:hypothetical protein
MIVNYSGHKAFYGPKSFTAEAKSVHQYPLTFDPQIEHDDFRGQMIISNVDADVTQTYNLQGKSDRGPPVSRTLALLFMSYTNKTTCLSYGSVVIFN